MTLTADERTACRIFARALIRLRQEGAEAAANGAPPATRTAEQPVDPDS